MIPDQQTADINTDWLGMLRGRLFVKAHAQDSAFTLVEMIVVIGIIGLLAVMVVPALSSVLRGLQITQGGNTVSAQIDLARQMAVSKNLTIEVRLIVPSGSTHFSAMALLKPTPVTTANPAPPPTPIAQPTILPTAVVIDNGATLSSLAQPVAPATGLTTPPTTDPPLGSLGTAYSYVSFYFYPDGSTSLGTATPPAPWFLTVHNLTDGDGLNKPPRNFYTIQVDPTSGRLTQFTP